ncbi:MAG: hypothetical protein KGJ90_05055 [Patescibacteria group bacterium]|nr:hypothetical protein [Patescibacteria group bacterium]
MADENISTTPLEAAAVSESAAAEPAAPAPQATETVAATEAAPSATEAKPEKPPIEFDIKPAESVLSKPEDEKAEDVKPAEEVKQEETKPVEVPTYSDFELPEGISFDKDRLSEFTKLLGEFELDSKADHAKVQGFAQSMIDRHIEELAKFQQTNLQKWEDEKSAWAKDFQSDEEIGGKRAQASIDAAHKFIRTHGGSDEQQKELYDILARTGLNNHKSIIRIFAKAANATLLSEPTVKAAPLNPAVIAKEERFYGKAG